MSTPADPISGREHVLSNLAFALDRIGAQIESIKTSIDYAALLTDEVSEPDSGVIAGDGSTGDNSAGLTDRECEVIQLIANGLSNAHIAEELFISTNTVARHIAGIFGKTDCENRVQAANYAREHNLLS
jgi:DNA-binding NarL/FixJ family response regulator